MRIVASVLAAVVAFLPHVPAVAQTPAPPAAYVAGQSGWSSDTAGTGLVTLRTTLAPKAGLAQGERPGFLLVLCTASQDRIIFEPNPSGSVRTIEPSANGTAYIAPLPGPGQQDDGRRFVTGLKTFPSGSFEIADLATGERNVARALVAELVRGATRFRFRLSGLPTESRFERDRTLLIEFAVGKADKPVLEQFETSCKLLGFGRP